MTDNHYLSDEIWHTFASAVVTVRPVSGPPVVVGSDELPGPGPTHVITGWNPGEERPLADNIAANERLAAEIDARHLARQPATGASPDGTWREDGFAVTGLSRHEAVELARRYGQMAIYEVDGTESLIVVCDDGRVLPTDPPEPA